MDDADAVNLLLRISWDVSPSSSHWETRRDSPIPGALLWRQHGAQSFPLLTGLDVQGVNKVPLNSHVRNIKKKERKKSAGVWHQIDACEVALQ